MKPRAIIILFLSSLALGACSINPSNPNYSHIKKTLSIPLPDSAEMDRADVDVYFVTDKNEVIQKRPVIIVGEILNSVNIISTRSALTFVNHGFHAVVVHSPNFIKIFNKIQNIEDLNIIGTEFIHQNVVNEATPFMVTRSTLGRSEKNWSVWNQLWWNHVFIPNG